MIAKRLTVVTLAASLCGFAPAGEVSELTIAPSTKCLPAERDYSAPKPKIESTFPADGATIRPGVLVLRITFDQKMTCNGVFLTLTGFQYPCAQRLTKTLTFDRHTFRAICYAMPGRDYGLEIGAPPDKLFVSMAGRAAEPIRLKFHVSNGLGVRDVSEALAEDKPGTP